jgi:hypothetical protein
MIRPSGFRALDLETFEAAFRSSFFAHFGALALLLRARHCGGMVNIAHLGRQTR